MTNGIDVLLAVIVLAGILAAVEYFDWKHRDEDRRIARLRERGLA